MFVSVPKGDAIFMKVSNNQSSYTENSFDIYK